MCIHHITIVWKAEFAADLAAVRFNGRPVGLTQTQLEAIALLIHARFDTDCGIVFLAESATKADTDRACQTVRRVRLAIDTVAGAGLGKNLIRSCGQGAYRLTIGRSQIEIHDNIRELVPTHLSAELVNQLLENYKAFGRAG